MLEETSETYIDVHDNLKFLQDGKRFIWSSELGGFNHLYLYGMDGKRINAITSGSFDVTEFYGINETTGLVYFQAANPTPMDRSLFTVKLNGKGQKNLLPSNGHQSPEFSSDFSFFILEQSNANSPSDYSLYSGEGKLIRTLESNKLLKDKLAEYNLSPKTFFN